MIHSKTQKPYRSLDHIFVDESVGEIIMEYFCDQYSKKGSMFHELDHPESFFSPDKNNKFSEIAQTFGYPETVHDNLVF